MTGQRVSGVDQYYWLTAFLAARGAQTKTCRMVALAMVGLGVIPLVLIGSSIGPQGTRDRLIAVVVAACSVLMALLWLRHRWPTRTESAVCVVVGTFSIAAACLITANPVVGMLGTTAFAALAAYIAFFHSLRLLVFEWAAAAATLTVLAVRAAADDAALAVSGVVVVILVNVVVAYACRTATRLIDAEAQHGEIEPLTGLLNRDAFDERAATLLASRSRDDDRYFVVAVVSIDSFTLRVDTAGARAGDRVRVAVGQTLRENVRQNAVIAHIADAEFLIADTFTTADASPLVERVRGAITTTPSGLTASIGVVSTPLRPLTHHPPHEVLGEVIAIATAAMYEARRVGGNRAHYVRNPTLTVLDEPNVDD